MPMRFKNRNVFSELLETSKTAAVAVQTLDFVLDEVREARLVPLVDFKGRRGQGPEVDAEQDLGQLPEDQKVDGGQD